MKQPDYAIFSPAVYLRQLRSRKKNQFSNEKKYINIQRLIATNEAHHGESEKTILVNGPQKMSID